MIVILSLLAFVLPLCFILLNEMMAMISYSNLVLILFRVGIGFILGLYVVLMNKLPQGHRRTIAWVHTVFIAVLLIFYMYRENNLRTFLSILNTLHLDEAIIQLFVFGGLAFGLTYHGKIKPLCPYPKTRMAILLSLPFLWDLLYYGCNLIYNAFGLSLPSILFGLLMGIYVWMLERLNQQNKRIVLMIHSFFGGLLCILMMGEMPIVLVVSMVQWLSWCGFSFILLLFNVKFISNSQNIDNI